MRIGVLADVHGNAVALKAVLREIQEAGVDRLICLGDVCVLGPQPRECLHMLLEAGCPTVLGNTDDWLLSGLRFVSGEPDPITTAIVDWTRRQLTERDMEALARFEPSVTIVSATSTIECFHGSPLSYNDVIGSTTPEVEVKRLLKDCDARVWIGGHTHVQMVRRHCNGHIVNPGSIGLPGVGPGTPGLLVNRDIDWAEYAILDVEEGSLSIDLRRTRLDMTAMMEAAQQSGMPYVDWWIGLYGPSSLR